jgi:hypothetical protein
MKTLIAIAALVFLAGCTDAFIGKIQALGGEGHVRCWSGTLPIYDGFSTGKIHNSAQSDGYYFIDRKTQKLTEVTGNCVIVYETY